MKQLNAEIVALLRVATLTYYVIIFIQYRTKPRMTVKQNRLCLKKVFLCVKLYR